MHFLKNLLFTGILSCCWMLNCHSQVIKPDSSNDFIVYIKLPPGISKSAVLSGNKTTKAELYNFSKSQLNKIPKASLTRDMDLIVVYTDQNGEPILPDKEKGNSQNYQPGRRNNNELSYTFISPDQPWNASQLTTLNTYLNDFYPKIKSIIGNPLFNITVNVRKDMTISIAGLYFVTTNEIVLRELSDHVLCHEIVHAFRDDYVMRLSTYEEGMTRATEVEVFNQLAGYIHSDEFHSYQYDYFYEGLNRPNIASFDGNVFTNITLQLLRYQIGSYIWAKAYLEDNNFLKRFNDSLFARTSSDPTTPYTESKLRNIFETIKPVVEGIPNPIWYNRQFLLNSSPSPGYKLYQRLNQYTIDHFYRGIDGSETPQGGVTISWEVFDYNNNLISSGNGISAPFYGFVSFDPGLPIDYNGRIKIVARVQSPDGLVTDTIYRTKKPYPNDEQGIFGIVEEMNTGTVSITPLDTSMTALSANLINGAFSFPALENLRGRFRCEFSYPDCSPVSWIFTKDRSKYFLSVKKNPITYWVGLVDNSWHNPLNWSGGLVPDECTDVIINTGPGFNCIINSPAKCRSFKISKSAVITVNNSLLINR